MKFSDMSEVQKRRLAGASEEALSVRRRLYMARVVGSSAKKVDDLAVQVRVADQRFEDLLAARGLCKSDRVRVTAEGELNGMSGEIESVDADGVVLLRYPDGESDRLDGADLELIEHATQKARHRVTRKERV